MIGIADCRHHLRRILSRPLHITWRKARRKMQNRVKRDIGRWRARLLGTGVSDAEFRRALDQRFPTIPAFLEHIKIREAPRFFLGFERRREFLSSIRERCPETEPLTIAAADKVCAHTFDLLGSGPTHLGERIDWHVDFKTGYRWHPRRYYADLRFAPYPGGYDIKVPWELSRCQHFAWLGQAYWLTGDEKYAGEFVAQVLDWIERNPPQFGVNWACTMDVAIRAINWLWGYYFFKDAPALTDRFRLAFFKSLLAHGRHIMNNLEWSEMLTGNHYLSDIVGLIYLGLLCPEFKEAARWRDFGLRELWQEMSRQVYPDGVDFEASISYHRLALELFLSPIILCQLNDIPVPGEVMERLEKTIEFVLHYSKPDGTAPLIGDADNGRLHRLKVWAEPEREWIDHRYLLAIGACLFQRDDFAQAAGEQWEEAFWLLGERGIAYKARFERNKRPLTGPKSQAFRHGGLYIMRHNDLYMIVDAGDNGQNGNGGHAHNDTLSFELYAGGRTFIADSGTYVYTADHRQRNTFRSTAYHNTVLVDGQEINRIEMGRLFSLVEDARPAVNAWRSTEAGDFFDGQHDGYQRLPAPLLHRRQIYFDKQAGFWLLRDLLETTGAHHYELHFHFAPLPLTLDGLAARTTCAGGVNLFVLPILTGGLHAALEEGWVSYSYGSRHPAPVLCYSQEARGPLEIVIAFIPFAEGAPGDEAAVRQLAEPILRELEYLACPRS
jgi:hypothetical protein